MSSNFLYSMVPVEENKYGNKYRIMVEVPLDGWYDDMYFVYALFGRRPAWSCDGEVFR